MRLLLVADDPVLSRTMAQGLENAGHRVELAHTVEEAQHWWAVQAFDAVLLDLNLPHAAHARSGLGSGLTALRAARARGDRTPVLVLSARDSTEERIAGLDAGADDYVLKPYDLDELLARIRALLRRAAGRAEPVYEHQGVSINPVTREVTANGEPVVLSAREWAVLEPLLARPGMVLSRSQLEEKLYGWKDGISSNAVEVYIHGLRKKLGADVIRNVRGVGYMVPRA